MSEQQCIPGTPEALGKELDRLTELMVASVEETAKETKTSLIKEKGKYTQEFLDECAANGEDPDEVNEIINSADYSDGGLPFKTGVKITIVEAAKGAINHLLKKEEERRLCALSHYDLENEIDVPCRHDKEGDYFVE